MPYANKERRREYMRQYHREYYQRPDKRAAQSAYRTQWKRDKQEELAGRPRPSTCELCGRTGRIVWDHNHDTGNFRGWLCYPCNTTLGVVGDDPEMLRSMAEYLEKHK